MTCSDKPELGGWWVGVLACSFANRAFHIVGNVDESRREGFLVAANDHGGLFPVTEVLAANALTDTIIIRAKIDEPVAPLPLNVNTYPGDTAWCYSDPLGRSGYFSKGMVNRFYMDQRSGKETARMEVSTDWAPGSSGAAVLDSCGNAIGHVSEISPAMTGKGPPRAVHVDAPVIVFHCAALAADVRALVSGDGE